MSQINVSCVIGLGNFYLYSMAFDLFKALGNYLPAETQNGVIVQDLHTMESSRALLSPHPLCPVCSHAGLPPEETRLQAVAEGAHDPDKRRVVVSSFQKLFESDAHPIAPHELSVWSGVPCFDERGDVEWLPAYSQSAQRTRYVPAATVYPAELCTNIQKVCISEFWLLIDAMPMQL